MKESCGNCKFYLGNPHSNNRSGECRRYPKSYFTQPPRPMDENSVWYAPCGYPYQEDDEWCGEWKPNVTGHVVTDGVGIRE
jgi:hypothetical protein